MLAPRRRAWQRGSDVESIRSRTSRGEVPSLSDLLELTHTVGSQAERTAAEAERNRKADDAAELVFSQSVLAESMVTLEALEQMLYRYADELMEIAHEQRTVDRATRAKLFAWRAYIARRAREVVGNLVDLVGARSIFDNDLLQRFWHDAHVMGQHVALNHEAGMSNYDRVLMGLDPDVPLY
jgi:hypothetical protein